MEGNTRGLIEVLCNYLRLGTEETSEILVRVAGIQAEIRTGHLEYKLLLHQLAWLNPNARAHTYTGCHRITFIRYKIRVCK